MITPAKILIAWTTLPDQASANRLAEALVADGLVACAQVSSPITSHYLWKGERCQEIEYRLTIKASLDNQEAITRTLLAHHPYELPQWLWCIADGALPPYLEWVLKAR